MPAAERIAVRRAAQQLASDQVAFSGHLVFGEAANECHGVWDKFRAYGGQGFPLIHPDKWLLADARAQRQRE